MPAPLPHDALARAVRAAFGAAARIVAEEPLAGDASSRRYVRLRLVGDPATAVAMLLGADTFGAASDELAVGTAPAELPFVNVARYLAARGLPVPAVYHDAARADGLLLLEDVGDTTLWGAVSAAPTRTAELFAAAVDLLVALQTAGVRAPDQGCFAFHRRFDAKLARAELEHFVEHGIETRHGRALDAAERRALLAAISPVIEPFTTAAPMLAHRDFMAWNLHVQGARLRLIDFQDALLGPDAFDLAQLLTDRTTSTLVTPELETELVARFRTGREAAGLDVRADFETSYRLCALQHVFKVIGRFYFLERVKGKPGYLAYLPSVYAVGRRLLAALPALGPALPRLVAHVPELAPEAA